MFQTGKTAQVQREMLLYRISMLAISECTWTGNECATKQPKTVRFPHFLPEEDMQDILAPEDHRKGTVSKDRSARHHYGNNAKKMEVAWVCYQERARLHNTNCIKVETG